MIMARRGGNRGEPVCVLRCPLSPWLSVLLLFRASHSRASSTDKGLLSHQNNAQKSHKNKHFCTSFCSSSGHMVVRVAAHNSLLPIMFAKETKPVTFPSQSQSFLEGKSPPLGRKTLAVDTWGQGKTVLSIECR